jgi:hypothetical protein
VGAAVPVKRESLFDARHVEVSAATGGRVGVFQQRDGTFDVSLIAAEGPSAAVYLTHHELLGFAEKLLARFAHESGPEIGESIERDRRSPWT